MIFRRRQRPPAHYGLCDRAGCFAFAVIRFSVRRLDGDPSHEHQHVVKLCRDHAWVGLEALLLPTRPCPMVEQSTP